MKRSRLILKSRSLLATFKITYSMKRLGILLGSMILSATVNAQSLEVTGKASALKPVQAKVNSTGVILSEADGTTLMTANYKPDGSDPSVEAYPIVGGGFVVRENIANFLIFDSFGKVKKSVSNSSQSQGGESISELAMDPNGKTIVLYNPKIVNGGNTGSGAKKISISGSDVNLFYSQDRALTAVEVSPNGEFVAFASVKSGTDDEVQLMDRFGNVLNTISFDQDVKGVSFSENGLFVTIYSGGRAAVYEVRSGERDGSTSFRGTSLIYANYSPEDKTIIGLTGSGSSTITDIQLHAVNVSARKIAREDFSGSLSKENAITFQRTGSGRYTISGFDKELSLRAGF